MRHSSASQLPLAPFYCRSGSRLAAAGALVLALAGSGPAFGQVPQGGEFRVNTTTAASQFDPAVAMNAAGAAVVVWYNAPTQGPGGAVDGQRYSATGAPVGGEFRVTDAADTDFRYRPEVAVSPDGSFVAVWISPRSGGYGGAVYARRYTSSGVAAGPEFPVGAAEERNAVGPSVAADGAGGFVVAWTRRGIDGIDAVYARQFGSDGTPRAAEIRVSTVPGNIQSGPSVGVAPDGAFVVVWHREVDPNVAIFDIFSQRFDPDGTPAGGQFRVNTYTGSYQVSPVVAVDGAGSFAVAWGSYQQDGSDYGVYAQRFTSDGNGDGPEFRVNTTTALIQSHASIAVAPAGDIVVVWESRNQGFDGTEEDIYAQRYDASGTPAGGEFRVNTARAGHQQRPAVAVDAGGNVVVVWRSDEQDGSFGVYGQRYGTGVVASDATEARALALVVAPSPVGPGGAGLRYRLVSAQHVRLSVSDMLGREVAVLHDGDQGPGQHEARFDASGLAPGVYVVRLNAGTETVTRRVTVAR